VSTPNVSVVVPAYNAAATLVATVQSVLDQTFTELEVLIVDDGSSDQTYSLARSLDDGRVEVIQQENRGVAAARNTGIKEARGNYIAFLDADDLWYPKKLEQQLAFMEREDARATQTAVWYVDDGLEPLYFGACPHFRDPLLEVLLFKHLPAFPSTLVSERRVFDKVGLFDESLPILEDWELAVRLARHGELRNMNEPLTMYRIHPGNRSRDLQLHIAPGLQTLERLFSDPQLPTRIRKDRARIYAAMFTMFSGGALRAGEYGQCIKWAFRALRSHPSSLRHMVGLPGRRMRRRVSKLVAR